MSSMNLLAEMAKVEAERDKLKAQRDGLLVAAKSLLVEMHCPCCEAKMEPHDPECTLSSDAPEHYSELEGIWARDCVVRAAIAEAEKP